MQRYGAHGVDYLELAPAPFEVFEDLLPMDAGGKELQAGACGAGAAGSESQPYLEGGIEAADLFGGRREDGLRGGAGSGDPAYRGRFFPVLVGFQGSGLGEFRPRLTRGGTSCRSLLAESDRLWGMIFQGHF
jgi:hypothetical protein